MPTSGLAEKKCLQFEIVGALGFDGFVGAPQMWYQLSNLRVFFREANRAMSKRSREVEKQT